MSTPLTPGPGPEHGHTPATGTGTGTGTGHSAGGDHAPGDTQQFGDVKVSTGSQSAYVTIELILYVLATVGIFVTAAIIDENDNGQGFGASEAWFYVTLLTVGFLVSRGLAKINTRGDSNRTL